jgi:hypothetical protein
VEYTKEIPGNPPPTLRIARGAVQWAISQNISELWVVAAKPHLWRALRDIKQAVYEKRVEIRVFACKEIKQYSDWFCRDSIQERVHSSKTWNKRECILKLLPFFIYKRVAN